jgi:hypothetical protein
MVLEDFNQRNRSWDLWIFPIVINFRNSMPSSFKHSGAEIGMKGRFRIASPGHNVKIHPLSNAPLFLQEFIIIRLAKSSQIATSDRPNENFFHQKF